jgi:hypothetical protein
MQQIAQIKAPNHLLRVSLSPNNGLGSKPFIAYSDTLDRGSLKIADFNTPINCNATNLSNGKSQKKDLTTLVQEQLTMGSSSSIYHSPTSKLNEEINLSQEIAIQLLKFNLSGSLLATVES